jgi:hypothetical protein
MERKWEARLSKADLNRFWKGGLTEIGRQTPRYSHDCLAIGGSTRRVTFMRLLCSIDRTNHSIASRRTWMFNVVTIESGDVDYDWHGRHCDPLLLTTR